MNTPHFPEMIPPGVELPIGAAMETLTPEGMSVPEHEVINLLHDAVQKAISETLSKYPLTFATVIGCLEFVKASIVQEAMSG